MLSQSLEDGDQFWRMPECYIRGNTIKYLRVPDEEIDTASFREFSSQKWWQIGVSTPHPCKKIDESTRKVNAFRFFYDTFFIQIHHPELLKLE